MIQKHFYFCILITFAANLTGCSKGTENLAQAATHLSSPATLLKQETQVVGTQTIEARTWIDSGETYNLEAPIPSQCYTKTEGRHNPCYVCHQTYSSDNHASTNHVSKNHAYGTKRPNRTNDGGFQGLYEFSDEGVSNSWLNLFKDRTDYIQSVSDEDILAYIAEDNYSPLINWMKTSKWKGEIPEIKNLHLGAQAFDNQGLAKDGSRWVAFNFKPLPSTFWPTNGSTDDVMIRLPAAFSEHQGKFSKTIYYLNLGLVEIAVKGEEKISIFPTDETQINLDLNGDGKLTRSVSTLVKRDHYVGDAAAQPLSYMLYPEGTEFLHSVRYVGVKGEKIYNSPRMKELRYMKKAAFLQPSEVASVIYAESREKHFEKLPQVADFEDRGISNKNGWMIWGFIEDQEGQLRKQHFEEQFFCMGCHKSIGTTIDHTFSFPRKVAGADGWGYINLEKIVDAPNKGEQDGEFLTYLKRVGGGDEFRQNQEMLKRWFTPDGKVKTDAIAQLSSIYPLITPSRERALQLNKAYQAIVKEQSYVYGRDTVIKPATNVYREIDEDVPPLEPDRRYSWDIRLDWPEK